METPPTTPSTPSSTHADLRSPSVAHTRWQKQKQKYHGFRAGPMSRIGQLFRHLPDALLLPRPSPFTAAHDPVLVADPKSIRVQRWTKRDQFDESRRDQRAMMQSCCCCCRTMLPREQVERSMKGRRGLTDWDPMDLDEDFDSIYDFSVAEYDDDFWYGVDYVKGDSEAGWEEEEREEREEREEDDGIAITSTENTHDHDGDDEQREPDYDFLSDVGSERDFWWDFEENGVDDEGGWTFLENNN